MIRKILLASALALLALAPSSASAYWPFLGYGGYGGYGYGWGFNQATNYVPAPPYYAIYPPVYYSSQITARHYGSSPFAWGPGMSPITYAAQPAPPAAPEPLMIENPFAPSNKGTTKQVSTIVENPYVTKGASGVVQASASEPDVQPLKIDNPYVVKTGR
jgi:hypothetical protein